MVIGSYLLSTPLFRSFFFTKLHFLWLFGRPLPLFLLVFHGVAYLWRRFLWSGTNGDKRNSVHSFKAHNRRRR